MSVFSVLIKPASSLCDLRCRYCFYADVSDLRQVKSYGIMEEATARILIDRAFAQCPSGTVCFAFQGGEPTLAGIEFFRRFTAYAKEHKPEKATLSYSIQTNGVTIDEDWCRLFREYGFLVGLSLDGEESLHDLNRVDASGRGTAERVLRSAALLKEHGVEFNILSVITKQAARRPRQLFRFLKSKGFDYVQFIPCLAPLENPGEQAPYALSPRQYAAFLKELFALWREEFQKGYYMSIRLFDNLVRMAAGQPPEMCGMLGRCHSQFVIEADGGVYPCDFYVLDEFRCGSILESSFEELSRSPGMEAFFKTPVPFGDLCPSCPVRRMCGGGCRRYRDFYYSEPGYCPYKDFLTACLPAIRQTAAAVFS